MGTNKANAWLITDEALQLSQTKSPDYMRARAVDEALAELAEILYTEPTGYQNNTILAKTKRVVSEWIARIAESFGFKEAATAWRGRRPAWRVRLDRLDLQKTA